MKTMRPSTDQDSDHNDGFQVTLSERAFIALLKTVALLSLVILQWQGASSQAEAPSSVLPDQADLSRGF